MRTRPVMPPLARTDGALGLLDGQQDGLGRAEEVAALLGQADAAGGAMNQAGAEMLLEGGDLAGDGGLSDAAFAGDGGERAGFCDADENTQGGGGPFAGIS